MFAKRQKVANFELLRLHDFKFQIPTAGGLKRISKEEILAVAF